MWGEECEEGGCEEESVRRECVRRIKESFQRSPTVAKNVLSLNNAISHLMCSECNSDPKIVRPNYLHHASSLRVYETHSLHVRGNL